MSVYKANKSEVALFGIKTASQKPFAIALMISVLLSACFLSNKKSEGDRAEQTAIDSGASDAHDTDASRVDERDATKPKEIPDGSVEVATAIFENVEVCLMRWVDVIPESMNTLADSQGMFESADVYAGQSGEARMFTLIPRKFGYRFDPLSINIESNDFSADGSYSGNIKDKFVAAQIETGPHATGQWKLVEYDCPQSPQDCLESGVHPTACAGTDCPPRAIGTLYTFERGCLLDEPSINCVEGTQYARGIDDCGYFPFGYDMIRLTEHSGEYDEANARWHIIEKTCITDTTLPPGSLSPCTTGELLLERAAAPAED
jgi:hypothetical protein